MRLIDADEFLKSEIERCGCVPLVGSCTNDNESLKYRLECSLTIYPESLREHGQWIMQQDNTGVCSNCHRQDHIDPFAKYCRYCGVEMCEEGRP